ncbi:MAG TPA: alpha/beta hydrolase [Acidimicrobiales bacterium]|nr:alpha/beta hydrolase [Acidimicrobiales bacterium]
MSATPTSAGADERRAGDRTPLPGLPEAFFVAEQPPEGGWDAGRAPVVVLVHGSLDRAASFGRVARRLEEFGVVSYDRRGYQGSRSAPVSDELSVHIDDLVRIAAAYAEHRAGEAGVAAIGHSVGATIVLGAAVAQPGLFRAVGAYEPSMPWLGFHRHGTPGGRVNRGAAADPGVEAERFFRRMVGDAAWERLPEEQRAGRRADGPALLADLRAIRRGTPFDVTTLTVPTVVSSGGPSSFPHHRDTVDWLAAHVSSVRRSTIEDAAHGAHLSHPDAFAAFVREVVALGAKPTDQD